MTFILETELLKQWFLRDQRDLPWRNHPDPYAVWVSEVMLQQTQVSVVIPYYERWMGLFPTIEQLANASLDQVIKAWEGLGYYSRARRLHAGAKYVIENFGGKLPDQPELLNQILGLGPYTIGAIRSFAFHQKAAAVDGNVIRVLARYFNVQGDIAKVSTLKKIWQIAEEILPEDESWIVNEGLIELGATLCGKKPQCLKCPLRRGCKAFSHGNAEQLPFKSVKTKVQNLYRAVAVIVCEDLLLVKRGKEGEIMNDLHEFPYFETDKSGITKEELLKRVHQEFGIEVLFKEEIPPVTHSFTRFQVQLNPVMFICKKATSVENLDWKSQPELKDLAFSSGHRRLFHLIQDIVETFDSTLPA